MAMVKVVLLFLFLFMFLLLFLFLFLFLFLWWSRWLFLLEPLSPDFSSLKKAEHDLRCSIRLLLLRLLFFLRLLSEKLVLVSAATVAVNVRSSPPIAVSRIHLCCQLGFFVIGFVSYIDGLGRCNSELLEGCQEFARRSFSASLASSLVWGPEGRHLRFFGVLKDDWGRSIDARGGAQEIIWPKWL